MSDQWDQFADSTNRTLDSLGWDATTEVYQPDKTYIPGGGFEVTFPADPDATLDAALDTPSDSAEVDEGGTVETADLTIYVLSDTDTEFTTAGASGDPPTGVIVDGQKYVVDTAENQFDGLTALACDEVNEWP